MLFFVFLGGEIEHDVELCINAVVDAHDVDHSIGEHHVKVMKQIKGGPKGHRNRPKMNNSELKVRHRIALGTI